MNNKHFTRAGTVVIVGAVWPPETLTGCSDLGAVLQLRGQGSAPAWDSQTHRRKDEARTAPESTAQQPDLGRRAETINELLTRNKSQIVHGRERVIILTPAETF